MQDVSLFLFDMKDRSPAQLAAARNGMRRLRTIKHPYLLKCYDAGEIPDNKGGGVIWIATEPVQPLDAVIDSLNDTPGALAWGVYTLAAAVSAQAWSAFWRKAAPSCRRYSTVSCVCSAQ